MAAASTLGASTRKKPASPMKTNGLNAFDVVGSHGKGKPILATGHFEAVNFNLIGEVVHLASQTNNNAVTPPSSTS